MLRLWWWAVQCVASMPKKKNDTTRLLLETELWSWRTSAIVSVASVTFPVCLYLGLKLSLSSRHPPWRHLCHCWSRPARRWRYCFVMYMPLERGQDRSLTLSGCASKWKLCLCEISVTIICNLLGSTSLTYVCFKMRMQSHNSIYIFHLSIICIIMEMNIS